MAWPRTDAATAGVKIVLCSGVFDLLHVAHIRHLWEARTMGDYLVVGLTMDKYVGKAGRPIIPEMERKEILEAVRYVSAVSLCKDSLEALEQWKPSVFCKGFDRQQIGLLPEEYKYCADHGIEVRFTAENPQHTSDLIERIRQ